MVFRKIINPGAESAFATGNRGGHLGRGHQPGIGIKKVAEIIVSGKLAAEFYFFPAHSFFDKVVSYSAFVYFGFNYSVADGILHQPTYTQIYDRPLRGQTFKQQAGNDIGSDFSPALIDKKCSVGVGIEGHAEIGGVFLDGAD